MDVLFSERAEGDDILANTLKRWGNVVLGMSIARKSGGETLLRPTQALQESAHTIGYFQPILDPANGLVYAVSPRIRTKTE